MAKVSVMTLEKAAVVPPPGDSIGEIETLAYFSTSSGSILLNLHRLAPGASFSIAGLPTDQMVYIWEGRVAAGGAILEARSSMIVEYEATQRITAGPKGASILLFRLRQRPEGARTGGNVLLLPYEIVPRTDSLPGVGKAGGALHADASCSTCELWLHENDYGANDNTAVHSHSEDEVIFVRDGTIRLGNRLYGPGTAIAVAANAKYGFDAGPEGLSFVNFRGTSPTYSIANGSEILDEAEYWRSALGSPKYLQTESIS